MKTRPGGLLPLLVFSLGGLLAGCSTVHWELDYERGMRKAVERRQRAIVQFYSTANRDCLDMDRKVFMEAKVQETMQAFVPIRLDMLLYNKRAQAYGVEEVPSFVIIRPDGSIAALHRGAMNLEQFRVFLIKHRYN